MSFILGNKDVLSFFEKAAKSGKHSHAYIIEGADGSGKLTLARAISATLICGADKVCFACPSCKRIMSGVHQDVKEISPEENKSVISIEQMRSVISDAYIKPAECDKKIFIIDGAHKTKSEAQNALLQILEEPPKNVIIFLLVPSRNLLLPTIKSRALTLKTEKFSHDFIVRELTARYPNKTELINEAALLSNGALGEAIEFIEKPAKRHGVETVKAYFSELKDYATFSSLMAIISMNKKMTRDNLFSLMTCFSAALRDILVYQSGCREKNTFFADDETLRVLADKLDQKKILASHEMVCGILKDIDRINVNLALTNICMTLSDDFS